MKKLTAFLAALVLCAAVLPAFAADAVSSATLNITELPEIRVTPSEATYLLWLDIRALPGQGEGFAAFLRKETGLYLLDGRIYGDHGRGFLRMNVACPRALLDDGLKRLKKGTEAFISR